MNISKAVCIAYHLYTPQGREFYMPLFNNFTENLKLWKDEFDTLYIIDSLYHFTEEEKKQVTDIKPNTIFLDREIDGHHWVQFKWVMPKIKEDAILFLDNDVVIYKKGIVKSWFDKIDKGYDFVGSFDGSGTSKETEKYSFLTKSGHKRMGSYYFILTKKLMDKIGDYTFEPLPEEGFDSFGKFTLQMLDTNPKIYEIIDDRSSIYFNGDKTPEVGLNLGYYHIRAGSSSAYLLATKKYGDIKTYEDYIKTQPKTEYLRQMAWYVYMSGNVDEILNWININPDNWKNYLSEFKEYHGI